MAVLVPPHDDNIYPDYDGPRRANLLNHLLYTAEGMIPAIETPRELYSVVTAVAMLIDRKRLEDGEVTSRTETVVIEDLRSQLVKKLNEVTERDNAARASGASAESRFFDVATEAATAELVPTRAHSMGESHTNANSNGSASEANQTLNQTADSRADVADAADAANTTAAPRPRPIRPGFA